MGTLPHRSPHLSNDLSATYTPHRRVSYVLYFLLLSGWALWVYWSFRYLRVDMPIKVFYTMCEVLILVEYYLALSKGRTLGTDRGILQDYHVTVLVPVYNENRKSLVDCLNGLLRQTRLPDEIHVVDDGSTKADYAAIRESFLKVTATRNIYGTWQHQPNQGKRQAQIKAFQKVGDASNTIVVTIDSDGILDREALAAGLECFADREVQSVAGVYISKNAQKSVLNRCIDLLIVAQFELVMRSAMSRLGCVLVNSGGLAFYRREVIDMAVQSGYTAETFFNRMVGFSDDSYLTLIAVLLGKTVQQERSIVFVDMPETLSHHFRQWLRWMRGSFIRSWWRTKYLPIQSWAFIWHLMSWVIFVTTTTVLFYVIIDPLLEHRWPPFEIVFIPVLYGYVSTLRYFTVRRSDMTHWSQFLIYMLSPLAALWSFSVLRFLRIYGMITCLKTGWGTRQKIEL